MSFVIAYCQEFETEDHHGRYMWNRTEAEVLVNLPCQYGGVSNNSQASRFCNERGQWQNVNYDLCLTLSESLLQNVETVRVLVSSVNRGNLILHLQIPVSQETLSNITNGVIEAILNIDNSTEDQSEANLAILATTFQKLGECTQNVRMRSIQAVASPFFWYVICTSNCSVH